jgi:spore maturation protein CgeB
MKMLYIGHYDVGSTSGMRGEYLKEILQPENYKVANIDIPLKATGRLFRSFGWRFKKGPLIKNINNYILSVIDNNWAYDLVWVDKGVFVYPSVIEKLKQHSGRLVHFTPDPAFTYHQSHLFYKALPYYDYCITTKSFETGYYHQKGVKQLITCTQGFRPDVHKPYHSFEEKKGIVFIGHHEKNREEIIKMLLDKNYPVTIAGIGWGKFAGKYKNKNRLTYLGEGIFGEEYARTLSGGLISLGLLSKIIPELHTTRTFEIPACGTAVITERNEETTKIFSDTEAFFFSSNEDLAATIDQAFADMEWLHNITKAGYKKVTEGGYDYKSILQGILNHIYS